MVVIDFTPAIGELRREFSNISDKVFKVAVSRALNHVAAKARTQAGAEVRKHYAISAKAAKDDIVIQRSNQNTLVAFLRSAGKPLPLQGFNPNAVRRGVSVKITGRRELIRGAFIATLKNGHKGVFARGQYVGSNFAFRKERAPGDKKDLPINELYSKSVPAAIMNRSVIQSLKERIESDLPQRVRHEVNYSLTQALARHGTGRR